MDRTTIFISSVAQDTFSSIRNAVFEELKNMGHEPIRFEDSMRYIHQDAIRTCLEYVSRSDIFLLFIADKAGTFLEDEGKKLDADRQKYYKKLPIYTLFTALLEG
jgi:hypothetical protein